MKRIIASVLFALAGLAASAQLFWKVTPANGGKESYIFGTHHIAPISLLDSISGLREAINRVDIVIGEIEVTSNRQGMMMSVQQYGVAPADSTLSKVMTAAQIDSLNVVLGKYTGGQLKAEMLDMLKPAMVNTQLAMMQSLTAFPDFNPSEQLDGTIQNYAKEAGKETAGLETAEQQFALLMGQPIAGQVEDLMGAVRSDSISAERVQELAQAYLTQNLGAISAMLLEDPEMTAQSLERLIYERNRNWADKLAEILPQKSAFIAVGCGHLPGEKGLLNLLKQQGYRVEPFLK